MPRFEKQGLKFAAVSYDSEEILKFFSDRHKIGYPMLADPESKIIRAYGVFNAEATGMQKGFARPGYFFIDSNGIITEEFFEAKYRERLTGNSLLAKLFPELGEEVVDTVEAPHLRSEEHTSELQSRVDLVCRLLLEKKKGQTDTGCPAQARRGGCRS